MLGNRDACFMKKIMDKQKRMVAAQKLDEEIQRIKSVLDQADALRQQAEQLIIAVDKLYLDKLSLRLPKGNDFLSRKTSKENM